MSRSATSRRTCQSAGHGRQTASGRRGPPSRRREDCSKAKELQRTLAFIGAIRSGQPRSWLRREETIMRPTSFCLTALAAVISLALAAPAVAAGRAEADMEVEADMGGGGGHGAEATPAEAAMGVELCISAEVTGGGGHGGGGRHFAVRGGGASHFVHAGGAGRRNFAHEGPAGHRTASVASHTGGHAAVRGGTSTRREGESNRRAATPMRSKGRSTRLPLPGRCTTRPGCGIHTSGRR